MDRRSIIELAAGAALGLATSAAQGTELVPSMKFAFEITVTLASPQEFGTFADGRRRFVPITGGTVTGDRLRGEVLAGGGDWQTIGADGVTRIHARYAVKASDGAVIEIDNPGVRVATPEIIARLTAGEDLDPSLYYFRTTPTFSVAGAAHDWLRRSIFVGVGVRHPNTVAIRVFQVS
jgi:Protein of unknown function (DUF3237)